MSLEDHVAKDAVPSAFEKASLLAHNSIDGLALLLLQFELYFEKAAKDDVASEQSKVIFSQIDHIAQHLRDLKATIQTLQTK
jgi:hypothetical protein